MKNKIIILIILFGISMQAKVFGQLEDITITNLAVRPSFPEICSTVEVEVVVRVLGAVAGYDNANHLSQLNILLPGFYYTRSPLDGTGDTPVNNETDFNTVITVESLDGMVYWYPPEIQTDHSVILEFLPDAVIPFLNDITITVTNMEIDDAMDVWSNTIEASIQHVAVDGDPDNDLQSVPTDTQACLTLPITLTSFTAEAVGKDAVLEWVTASEQDNDYYEVERSLNGVDFEYVATIDSQAENGNSEEELSYTHADLRAAAYGEQVYYRVKQTDFDGTFSYTPVRLVEFTEVELDTRMFPNPAVSSQNVVLQAMAIETVEVFTMKGELVKVIEEPTPTRTTSISTGDLARGVYMVVINGKETQKLVVQ